MGELTHHCIYQGDKKSDSSHVDTGKSSIVPSGFVQGTGQNFITKEQIGAFRGFATKAGHRTSICAQPCLKSLV